MKNHLLVFSVAVSLVSALLFSNGVHAKDLPSDCVLVDAGPAGVAPAQVLTRAGAPAQEIQAAQELARYLSQISGADFTVATAGAALPDRAILVGELAPKPSKDVSEEGFVIRTDGQRLSIRGGSPHATLLGVFSFLERDLGCRWWSRNEEDVPGMKSIRLPRLDRRVEPAFRRHNIWNREAQATDNFFAYKRGTVSLIDFTGGHTLCPMLRPYTEKNPEFLPMDKDGHRKFNDLHMNYTAPGMPEALAEVIETQIKQHQGDVAHAIYFAGMGDWYGGMDLSPESKKIYEEETWTDPDGVKKPGYSATLLRMINKTAELLEAKHPGVLVGTFAYMSLEAPPAITRPRGNVVIRLPRLRHDTVRSVLESPANQSYRRNLERWAELAPGRVYIWEYGANFSNFLKPFPCLRSMAENIKLYHKLGIAGVEIQGNYSSLGGDMAVLKNYVWSRIMWDPALSVDDAVKEFCEGYYGPAAKPMIDYVNLIEGSVRGEKPMSLNEFDKTFAYLTPEVIKKAQTDLGDALAATHGEGGGPYYRRVREAGVSLEAYFLWNAGPLKEEGEKLVRADLGDTAAHAADVVKYCREASPGEFSTGLNHRMIFLTWHGGPMPILKQGTTTVKVAPVQNGELRSVLCNDVVAIDQSTISISPGSISYEMTKREGNRVEMKSGLGYSNWGPPPQTFGHQTVELGSDGAIHQTASATDLQDKPVLTQATALSTYNVGQTPGQLIIEYQDGAGAWQAVNATAEKPTVPIPLAKHIRITRRDRGVVIDDGYPSPGEPTGTVTFDPKASTVVVAVTGGKPTASPPQSEPALTREIRVSVLKP